MKHQLKRVMAGAVAVGLVGAAAASDQFGLVVDIGAVVSFISVDGDGSLDPLENVNSPTALRQGAYGVGIGDFDNDGLDDYLAGGATGVYQCTTFCGYPATIEFHRRTGEGNQFAPGVAIAGGWSYYVMDFAVADYNSDGNLDFAVNDYSQWRARVYFGHGDGTFAAGPVFDLGQNEDFRSIAMDAADVNNDGNTDFMAARYYDNFDYNNCYYSNTNCIVRKQFQLFLGDGDGGFSQQLVDLRFNRVLTSNNYYYYYNTQTWGVALADYDGDGNVDIAATERALQINAGHIFDVFLGNGDGSFSSSPIRTGGSHNNETWTTASIDNADLNEDGIQDLLLSSMDDRSVRTYLGAGDGTFTETSYGTRTGQLSGVSTRPGDKAYDRRKPVVTLNPTLSLTNQPLLAITGTAKDSGGVVSVELLLNGQPVRTPALGAGGAVSDTVDLLEGENVLQLRATDRAGNVGVSTEQTVVLDTQLPLASLPKLPAFATDEHFDLTAKASDTGSGIATVTLRLNGNSVPATYDSASASVRASLTLVGGTNQLELFVTDRAGNESLHSRGTINLDDEGPTIDVADLAPFTNQPSQTVRGRATDNQGIESLVLVIDGSPYSAPFSPTADGTFAVDVVLSEGAHTLTVRATDRAGLSNSDSTATNLDTVPPTALLDSVARFTNRPVLDASGRVGDDNSGVAHAKLSIVGGATSGDLGGSDTVAASLALTEGPQTVVLEVVDRAGNVGATSAEITLDTIAPRIRISSPLENQPFGDLRVPVVALVDDATPTLVSFGSLETQLAAGGGQAVGSYDALSEGPGSLTVSARDAAGNTAQASVGFLIDLSAPLAELDLGGFADGAEIGPQPGHQLLYTVRVDDATAVTGEPSWAAPFSLPEGGGVQQGVAPLVEGRNIFTLRLTDVLGHETQLLRAVTYDITPPTARMTGTLATAGSPVRGTVELSAEATDALTGVVSGSFAIDGDSRPATTFGQSFGVSIDTTTLSDGPHAVTATFVDRVGNSTTIHSSILVDNSAPSVAITAPSASAHVRQTVTLTAAASDATSGLAGVDIFVNGRNAGGCASSPCSVSFDTLALANGPFLVTATARDKAGNTGDAEARTVIADNEAPSKFLVSPIAGATVTGSVTVTVNVVDDAFAGVECFVDGVSLGASTSPTFSSTVNLLGKLDGAVVVTCSATDLAGNVGTESATVRLKNWKLDLDPKTLNVKSNGNEVKLVITGPNLSVLLPATDKALSLVVAGGSPAPLATRRDGYAVKDGVLELKFDRPALVASIKAGIATGAINPAQPLTVRFFAGSRELGSDTIRVEGAK